MKWPWVSRARYDALVVDGERSNVWAINTTAKLTAEIRRLTDIIVEMKREGLERHGWLRD